MKFLTQVTGELFFARFNARFPCSVLINQTSECTCRAYAGREGVVPNADVRIKLFGIYSYFSTACAFNTGQLVEKDESSALNIEEAECKRQKEGSGGKRV